YSFIGNNPFLVFSVKKGKAYLEHFSEGKKVIEPLAGEPIAELKQLLQTYQIPEGLDLPRFAGGAIGYIGYDAISLIEAVPEHLEQVLDQDQIRLMFCDNIMAYNHLQQEVTFITYLRLPAGATETVIEAEYTKRKKALASRIESIFQK